MIIKKDNNDIYVYYSYNKLNKYNIVVVLSGGLDSTILTNLLSIGYGNNHVYALSFNYGQKHNYELECAVKTCKYLNIKHNVINIDFLQELVKNKTSLVEDGLEIEQLELSDLTKNTQYTTYVPFRNMLFLNLAAIYAESINANKIFIGVQSQDSYGYWDCHQKFINNYNKVLDLSNYKIKVVSPFINLSKSDEIKLANKYNIDFNNTWTCYTGPNKDGKACGTCPSCLDRKNSFKQNNIADPILYIN